MEKNIGVYICTGCGIDQLDIEKIKGIVENEFKLTVKTHPALCGREGVEMIKKDIENGVNTVVICACSPRVKEDVFNFGEDIIVERVNLREGVVWSHDIDEHAQ